LRDAVQAHAVKARLLGRTKARVGDLAPYPRAIGVAVAGEHHGQGVNQVWSNSGVYRAAGAPLKTAPKVRKVGSKRLSRSTNV
jgi:hypothetical protein